MSSSPNTNTSDSLFLRTVMGRLYVEEKEIDPRISLLVKEESEVYEEILNVIHSGEIDLLKPNSGVAVTICSHSICVTMVEEKDSDCRDWQWHGLIGTYDPEMGYTPEYIYGFYTERLGTKELCDAFDAQLRIRDSIDGNDANDDSSRNLE